MKRSCTAMAIIVLVLCFLPTTGKPQDRTGDSRTVKYTRDAEDRIIGIELPKGTTTAQFEKLEVPATLRSFIAHETKLTTRAFRSLASKCELTTLDVSDSAIDESFAAAISEMTSLESLNLSGTDCNDALLALIAPNLQKLESLDISRTRVTNRALPAVASLSHLRHLCIARCKIAPRVATELSGEPQLSTLGSLTRLSSLDITGLGLDDGDAKHLTTLSSLTAIKLDYGSCSITAKGIRQIRDHNPDLRIAEHICRASHCRFKLSDDAFVVEIGRAEYDDVMLIPQEELARLEVLELIRPSRLSGLVACSALRSLSLRSAELLRDDVAELAKLPSLNELRFTDTRIDETLFSALQRIRQIRTMTFTRPSSGLLPPYIESAAGERVRIVAH